MERLEDCRIYTSFYSLADIINVKLIGRLPYLYFLLLSWALMLSDSDWKTAVFILPSTTAVWEANTLRLEDCRIYTSFYYRKLKTASYQRFLLFVVVKKSQQTRLFVRLLLFFIDKF